jgi:hypothetical protein
MPDVGDVHYVLDFVSPEQQGAAQPVDKEVCPHIADVRGAVDGRAAGVHTDRLSDRRKELFFPRQCIIQ